MQVCNQARINSCPCNVCQIFVHIILEQLSYSRTYLNNLKDHSKFVPIVKYFKRHRYNGRWSVVLNYTTIFITPELIY